MSEIDTKLPPTVRAAFLEEVRYFLPAFLSSAAVERVDPVGDVTELLNLRPHDLRQVAAVHLGLSGPVTDLAAALPGGLRRPITSTTRPRVTTQAVRGSIDWNATMKIRATGAATGLYVVTPARRIFDTPENRALAWVLRRLEAELSLVSPNEQTLKEGWGSRIQENLRAVRQARRQPWLRDIRAERPSPATLKRLAAARTAFYKIYVPEVVRALWRWVDNPSPESLTDLLSARYFEPSRDWQLFEIVIALRLARAFAEISTAKRRPRLLTGTGRSPFAVYKLENGAEVRLWYQAWPESAGTSLHTAARQRHQIQSGSTRPDIIIERTKVDPEMIVLELKATREPGYLTQGLSQILGYLKERPEKFAASASGWLVAPKSPAFHPALPAADQPLWVVADEDVVAAAVARIAG